MAWGMSWRLSRRRTRVAQIYRFCIRRIWPLYSVSNPYRSMSDLTYGLTKYTYDALNRPLTVTHPDLTALSYVYGTGYKKDGRIRHHYDFAE